MIGDAPLIYDDDSGAIELMANEAYGRIDGDNCNEVPSTPLASLL